jgi:two-component system cell cycle sensor histidine kinase/response regulator CckA
VPHAGANCAQPFGDAGQLLNGVGLDQDGREAKRPKVADHFVRRISGRCSSGDIRVDLPQSSQGGNPADSAAHRQVEDGRRERTAFALGCGEGSHRLGTVAGGFGFIAESFEHSADDTADAVFVVHQENAAALPSKSFLLSCGRHPIPRWPVCAADSRSSRRLRQQAKCPRRGPYTDWQASANRAVPTSCALGGRSRSQLSWQRSTVYHRGSGAGKATLSLMSFITISQNWRTLASLLRHGWSIESPETRLSYKERRRQVPMSEAEQARRLESMIRAVRSANSGDPTARLVPSERQDRLDELATEINDLLRQLATRSYDARGAALASTATERASPDEETQMLRFSMDEAPDAVFWMVESGRFAYVNDQACRSLGYSRDELLQLSLWDIDPYFPKDRLAAEWAVYRKGELGMQHLETFHRRKDGIQFPVEVSSRHIWFGESEFHVAFVRDITERRRVERALQFTQFAVDHASLACFWIDSESRFLYVNDQACLSLGYSKEDLLRLSVYDIDSDFPADVWRDFLSRLRREGVITLDTHHRRKSGERLPVEVTANFIAFEGREYSCAFVRDTTDKKRAEAERARLESQLLHAQKMESIGRLAGGVAHEFNNMLSVILGSSELIRSELTPDDPLASHLQEIDAAALRSRDITRQLLAFSRMQVISPRATNLNEVIAAMRESLSRLIGEDVEFRFEPAANLSLVRVDRTQLEQILLNLVVNARDAMPEGGRLVVVTANEVVKESGGQVPAFVKPGVYVSLVIRDDGIGMTPEVQSHLFEPFFTTKEPGKGTGLGLATVYGIVKQNDGFIGVDSTPGQGTSFTVYLPVTAQAEAAVAETSAAVPLGASGRVLLVEDDEAVRTTITAVLKRMGFSVEAASTPAHAIRIVEQSNAPFDLLLSDVVMPGLSGSDLKKRLSPSLRVLFMSGYSADVIAPHGVLEEGVHLIQKPFTMVELALKIGDVMRGD